MINRGSSLNAQTLPKSLRKAKFEILTGHSYLDAVNQNLHTELDEESEPYLVRISNFISRSEIKAFFSLQKNGNPFERSTIVVDGQLVYSGTRTSSTAFITDSGHFNTYSSRIEKFLEKVCYLAGCSRRQIESIMIVKYEPGQEYYDHHDYFLNKAQIKDGGQRIATFFVYLSDVEEGGNTEFPRLGISSPPRKGDALFWWNGVFLRERNYFGPMLVKTEHRGTPVEKGTKYGLNVWIRSKGWRSS